MLASRFLSSGLAAAALLAVAACVPAKQTTPTAPRQPSQPRVEAPEPVRPAGPPKVALLLPLSGEAARIGMDMQNAAEMALFDAGPNDLVLLPRDTQGTAEGAREAARDAIAEGAELILGPLFGPSTRAVAPVARAADRYVLSFSNDASVAGGGVWVLGFRPEEQVERVLDYALADGLRRIGALVPDNPYGALAARAWRDVAARSPALSPAALATYPTQGEDPSPIVRDFLARHGGAAATEERPAVPPELDALLIADGGLGLRQMVALLAFYGADSQAVRYLGTQLWLEDPTFLTDPSVRGAWIAAVAPELEEAFERRFAGVFGREPHPLAALAYDATALAVLLAQSDRRFAPDLLTDPQGFAGHAGIFRLMPDGTAQHGLSVLELGPDGPRVVDPAPGSFAVVLAN